MFFLYFIFLKKKKEHDKHNELECSKDKSWQHSVAEKWGNSLALKSILPIDILAESNPADRDQKLKHFQTIKDFLMNKWFTSDVDSEHL